MIEITEKLKLNLKKAIKDADEIWIAVALFNLNGFSLISNELKENCKINFLGGIDLPTEPKALAKLLSLSPQYKVSARMYTKDIYHPKVYILRKGKVYKSFVGSSNCTRGGLESNIEMTTEIDSQTISRELIRWFNKLYRNSNFLTDEFISNYKDVYQRRIKRNKRDKYEISEAKKIIQKKSEVTFKKRKALIEKLREIRNSNEYRVIRLRRKKVIEELRSVLDYPRFRDIDLARFWQIKDLGTIVPIEAKGAIENNKRKFTKLLQYLCNDDISIATRINEAKNGKLSINDIALALISKVLVVHNPNKYYVDNKEFKQSLAPFGLSIPRGKSLGERYELIGEILKEILEETKIDNYAILDQCLIMDLIQ